MTQDRSLLASVTFLALLAPVFPHAPRAHPGQLLRICSRRLPLRLGVPHWDAADLEGWWRHAHVPDGTDAEYHRIFPLHLGHCRLLSELNIGRSSLHSTGQAFLPRASFWASSLEVMDKVHVSQDQWDQRLRLTCLPIISGSRHQTHLHPEAQA